MNTTIAWGMPIACMARTVICNAAFDWKEVRVWSRSKATLDHFAKEQRPKCENFTITTSTDIEKTVGGADIGVTLTPARNPMVMADWISPGTHIAAEGAGKKGDQELEGKLLKGARIFVDDIRQCRTDGEIKVPLPEGLTARADLVREIGKLVTAKKKGRALDTETTIFEPTGIALKDSATVPVEYERAMAAGVGIEKKMIST